MAFFLCVIAWKAGVYIVIILCEKFHLTMDCYNSIRIQHGPGLHDVDLGITFQMVCFNVAAPGK
jgi:hypothetical protein